VCDRCATTAAPAPRSEESLLIRANLLRIRGQWDSAAEQCADVLRLDPTNPTAHSLLGDILQDQGRSEEARHWYQLALDLNPSSEADRAKLARADEMLEARQQRAEWEAIIEGRSQPVSTSLTIRETVQRVGALVGVALCAIVLVMAALMTASERGSLSSENDQAPFSAFVRRRPPPLVMDTARERELLKKTNETAGGGLGQAVRVELDARGQSANLRVFVPRKVRDESTTPEYRIILLREGYRFARALHEADSSLRAIRLTLVGPIYSPGGSSDTGWLLMGTLSGADLVVPAETITPAELAKFYGEVTPPLWAPELTTPG
jgi:hypothetical protein